jgi:hypothetical protein
LILESLDLGRELTLARFYLAALLIEPRLCANAASRRRDPPRLVFGE